MVDPGRYRVEAHPKGRIMKPLLLVLFYSGHAVTLIVAGCATLRPATTQASFAACRTELTLNSAVVDPEQLCAVKSPKAVLSVSRPRGTVSSRTSLRSLDSIALARLVIERGY